MTATDELRRMLDERGVEWREHTELQGEITLWNGWQFFEGMASYNDGYSMLSMVDATPAQAVEATLGRGECQEVKIDRYWRGCGECGYVWEFMYGIGKCERPRYCPNCGRNVVDE